MATNQQIYDLLKGAKITGGYLENRPNHKHKGIDLALPLGSPIHSGISGIVKGIYNDPKGYGNYAVIEDPETGISSKYAHAESFDVKPSQKINAGDIIGIVGATGRSTGPHLHYETALNGQIFNPMELQEMLLKRSIKNQNTQDLRQQIIDNALAEQQPQEQQQKDPLKQAVIDALMKQMQPQPTRIASAGDVVKAFQEHPEGKGMNIGKGLGALSEYLGTSQGQNVAGGIMGLFGGKEAAINAAINARELRAEEEKQKEYDYGREKNQLDTAESLYKTIQGGGKGGSSFKDAVDIYYTQGMIDEDKYNALKNTASYANDDSFAPSIMGKMLQPFLNTQTHGYKAQEIGLQGGQQRQTAGYKEELPSTQTEIKKKEQEIKKLENMSKLEGTQGAITNLNAIKDQMDRFSNTFKVMPSKTVAYTAGKVRELTGTQTTGEANFDAQRTLLFNRIARDLGGEKGVLSDQDIIRVEKSLPTLTDSKAQKEAKMKAIDDLLKDRFKQYGKINQSTPIQSGKYKVTVVK